MSLSESSILLFCISPLFSFIGKKGSSMGRGLLYSSFTDSLSQILQCGLISSFKSETCHIQYILYELPFTIYYVYQIKESYTTK